ncbi:McrC family protein [Candidatus Nitrosotenuis sp. DW1]|uniref:McrC family protein n=1 Tax=Candidatus Nitrosotenuis sp. DW1 TaxID=2259672 RepID=UPI0015C9A403|nr:hypothetical protein [Candidatus Nitrosotenuis sp. DW1]QLH09461.1 hypothetical protein DSQ19_08230 [Candidatus Nitrosotenuis sp. DW1]
MNDLVEISEYRTLSPTYDKTEESQIDANLKNLKLTDKDQELKNYLKQRNILKITELKQGIQISSTSYIGIAQFSEFSVMVMPKLLMNPNNLPKLIEYAYELDDVIIPQSEIKFESTKNLLVEIILASFIKKCQQLLRQGLVKSYVTHQDNIPYLRGKLLLQQQFLNAMHKKLQFACEYDELEYNNLENQIVLFTLEKSYLITNNVSIKKEIRKLIHQFSGFVDKVSIQLSDFNKISYTRLNQHYEKTHQLCSLILRSIGIGDFYKPKTPFVNSFFIDMNKVFESFVARLFREFYPLSSKQQKGEKAWEFEDGKTAQIRTDILTYRGNKVDSIIDTKYKKYVSEADRFQIGFYIHEYGKKAGFAILPKHAESKDHQIKSIKQGITINVNHIDIDKTITLLKNNDYLELKKLIVKLLIPYYWLFINSSS